MMNNNENNNTGHYQDLKTIVRLASGYQQLYRELTRYPQTTVIYTLSSTDVIAALEQVQLGRVDIEELELWASLLEMRGDIDHSCVEGVLYALANPEQMGEISHEKVSQLLTLLKK
ncbi:hypothetical protein PSECIP111854_01374 [Pseudoalteromonas sp. CIP111854]|uniref:Uncharacterized protein n=1 Tax=Pseudoalteromonas holothuriae TaxID=2963714 RepID=A0A9W4QV77_9GAMM|nr:hypothetical protein [Pseudoalteromonas sp. CIP111854]CAH9054437.1 hypothetical protein PSECIP111854_01374 [Pseudoalteromonas sp. CIP111854]